MNQNEAFPLTTNDMLGIIQRQLAELNAYCGQAPHHVDRDVCMKYLERIASFVVQIPPAHVPSSENDDAPSMRN